jgi:hypothetical protein
MLKEGNFFFLSRSRNHTFCTSAHNGEASVHKFRSLFDLLYLIMNVEFTLTGGVHKAITTEGLPTSQEYTPILDIFSVQSE